jgi:redox-sensitive bicupin YhaK (pirin superfamily)
MSSHEQEMKIKKIVSVGVAPKGHWVGNGSTVRGGGGTIGPGDVQCMTAASGILHDEFHSQDFTRTGGTMEMVQLWVNLPAKDKMSAPKYQTLKSAHIPSIALANNAGQVRVIAGEYGDRLVPTARRTARSYFMQVNIRRRQEPSRN